MKQLTSLLLILLCKSAFSQDLIDNYYEFGGAITEGRETAALTYAEKILPEVSALSGKRQAIFYYKLAGLHENRKSPEKAIEYYERTLKLEPDYYVPHMALGYLYVGKANFLVGQINAEKSNIALREKYISQYKANLRKAVPYFEKAMACDPNDQVLASIKNAYDSLKDPATFKTLDSRLKVLEKNCVSLIRED